MEYCSQGNMLSYVQKHADEFKDYFYDSQRLKRLGDVSSIMNGKMTQFRSTRADWPANPIHSFSLLVIWSHQVYHNFYRILSNNFEILLLLIGNHSFFLNHSPLQSGCKWHGILIWKKYLPWGSSCKEHSSRRPSCRKGSRLWSLKAIVWKFFDQRFIQRKSDLDESTNEMASVRSSCAWTNHSWEKRCLVIWGCHVGNIFVGTNTVQTTYDYMYII